MNVLLYIQAISMSIWLMLSPFILISKCVIQIFANSLYTYLTDIRSINITRYLSLGCRCGGMHHYGIKCIGSEETEGCTITPLCYCLLCKIYRICMYLYILFSLYMIVLSILALIYGDNSNIVISAVSIIISPVANVIYYMYR
jgi:hypothetical protein